MRVYIYSFAQRLHLRGSPGNRVTDARNDRQDRSPGNPAVSLSLAILVPLLFHFLLLPLLLLLLLLLFLLHFFTLLPLLLLILILRLLLHLSFLLLFLYLSSFFPYSSSSLYTSMPPSF